MLFDHPIEIQGNALFISDAHLRTPEDEDSKQRETKLIQLLESKKGQFQHLFLLGDIFDFWFEYGDVAPKGYFRLFNLLYELNESGVKIYYFPAITTCGYRTISHNSLIARCFTINRRLS